MVCYDRIIFEKLVQNLNVDKIIFKVVQMYSNLAVHITNQKCSFYIFMEMY